MDASEGSSAAGHDHAPERRGGPDPTGRLFAIFPGHESRRRDPPEPEDVGEQLADFVRRHREALRLSQQEAADSAGLSKTTWQQVEGGRGTNARNLTLHAMARVLGVEAALLFNLRSGLVTAEEAEDFGRDRAEIIQNILHGVEWLRRSDLLAIEDSVNVRVELRRRQRTEGSTG